MGMSKGGGSRAESGSTRWAPGRSWRGRRTGWPLLVPGLTQGRGRAVAVGTGRALQVGASFERTGERQ